MQPDSHSQEPPSSDADPAPASGAPHHQSRFQLVFRVLGFQFKLLADGLRDLLLSPLSFVALLAGLLLGGDRPGRYFERLLTFGRRSERWINLFGTHSDAADADALLRELEARVQAQAQDTPWLKRAGSEINRHLDQVNDRARQRRPADGNKPSDDSTDG